MRKFFISTAAVLALTFSAVGLVACGTQNGEGGDNHEHTLVKHEAVEKTCTEAGSKLYWECSDCGKLYLDEQATNETTAEAVVIAAGHTEEILPGKAATCTETGLTEGKKCSVCGETLVAQNEIAVDSNAHNYEFKFNESEHWYECTVCRDETEPEAHKGGTATADKRAECEVCGEEYGDYAEGEGALDFNGEDKKFGASLAEYEDCELQENETGYDGNIFGGVMAGGTITYTINSLVKGTFELRISVAGGSGNNEWWSGWGAVQVDALEVFVNGTSLGKFDVGPTEWTGFYELPVGNITLQEGENIIEILAVNASYNFNYLLIAPLKIYNGSELIYGAANATAQNCSVQSHGDGYDGNIIGGISGESNSVITFTVDSAVEADVTLTASLAGGVRDDSWTIVGEAMDAFEIFVNGVSIGKINVGTGDWTNFTEILIGTAKLNAGQNTIELRALSGNTNFSYLKIDPATGA